MSLINYLLANTPQTFLIKLHLLINKPVYIIMFIFLRKLNIIFKFLINTFLCTESRTFLNLLYSCSSSFMFLLASGCENYDRIWEFYGFEEFMLSIELELEFGFIG